MFVLADDEDRTGRFANDTFGDAAQQCMRDARVAMSRNDQEVYFEGARCVGNFAIRPTLADDDVLNKFCRNSRFTRELRKFAFTSGDDFIFLHHEWKSADEIGHTQWF